MYSTILVPLDGSKRAEAILPHVQKVARSGHSKVILLNVLEKSQYAGAEYIHSQIQFQQTVDEEEQHAKSMNIYLEGVAEDIRRLDIKAECRIISGSPVAIITRVAEEENADLIAIASHGRSGLGRVFYGSVAAGLVHSADRPLLIIRSRNL